MKPRHYAILCEDLQAYVFIRRALIEAGADGRNIWVHPYPDSRFHAFGGGSPRPVDGYAVYACGSQHVRANYPRALGKIRAQHAKRAAALVVHMDVDNAAANARTVRDRLQELEDSCKAAAVAPREQDDPVALLIPRREIETWIHFLRSGQPVDELAQYEKLTDRESDCQPAAEAFARHACAKTTPPGAPPSLIRGLSEFAAVLE